MVTQVKKDRHWLQKTWKQQTQKQNITRNWSHHDRDYQIWRSRPSIRNNYPISWNTHMWKYSEPMANKYSHLNTQKKTPNDYKGINTITKLLTITYSALRILVVLTALLRHLIGIVSITICLITLTAHFLNARINYFNYFRWNSVRSFSLL